MEPNATFSAAAGPVSAYIEWLGTESGKPAVFPLHDEAVIGRGPQDALANDKNICIPEQTISRRHARIRRRGANYFIEDLHSRNGTFVSGERLPPGNWHALRDGEELALASAQLVFHSLMLPERGSAPTVITRSVDATRFAPVVDTRNAGRSELENTVHRLHAMAQVSIALGAVTDQETLIDKIMNLIFDLFPLAERAFIMLRGTERDPPRPVAARRRGGTVEDPAQLRISHTIVDEVLVRKRAILSVDTLADRHFGSHESIVAQAILSVMCVPLIIGDEVLGLLQVDTSSDPYAFQEADLEILSGVCAETAVALKNFQLYSDIKGLLDGFVCASVQAIEERDPVTAGHSFRVAGYAEALALAMEHAGDASLRAAAFTPAQLREIRYAALLHDFGKVGVREHVLRKEKKLHHADMRLLEERFRYARACLERHAWRSLAERHLHGELSMTEFRRERERIEAELLAEGARLDGFLELIVRANEPSVSHTEPPAELDAIRCHACTGADDPGFRLLNDEEFSALNIGKGCLTPDERRQIEAHVADSYSFLILIPWTRELAGVPAIAHGHHEKLDGSGYPMGLRDGQISLQTRILTISDIYDALTARDRPYKQAVPPERALDLIAEECRAGHLDERLFRVFVDSKAWEKGGELRANT
ncbi:MULTISPECIES: HD domain-containing phosphohydrolase [unclassified Massilia]|uniref:HD domain-containing phosphohydrolase n=1 Tax=unclassified Massilia TaxID=2609279 RepID=UPI001E64BC53|nr:MULTISPECIES: HD domain-containing phosphohydrolase [unclassified Massilia]